MNDYDEKRDFLRMAIDCEFSFNERDSDHRFDGQVINLSSKGILFTSSDKFDVGTQLEILLTPSNSLTPPMEASGVVTRVIEKESIFEIACQIDEIH